MRSMNSVADSLRGIRNLVSVVRNYLTSKNFVWDVVFASAVVDVL
jgi:hypothetical protein